MKRMAGIVAVALVAMGMQAAPADMWEVDNAHSEVGFTVTHFFTPVNGRFDDFEATLLYDPENPENSEVDVTVSVTSVDTNNERRDNHLRSGDFFEAETHPEITFRSTSVERTGENTLVARGPLTMKGVTREIELPITVLGIKEIPAEMQAAMGGAKRVASFQAETTLDRRDFGVGVGDWAATLVVGSDVDVRIALAAALKD